MARRSTAGTVVPGGLKFNEKTGFHEPVNGPTKRRDTSHFTKWDQDAIVMGMYAALHPEEYARAFRASGKTANSFKMGVNADRFHLGLSKTGLTGYSNLGMLKVASYKANPDLFELEAKEILRRKENGTL